jgi:hypothetical protein
MVGLPPATTTMSTLGMYAAVSSGGAGADRVVGVDQVGGPRGRRVLAECDRSAEFVVAVWCSVCRMRPGSCRSRCRNTVAPPVPSRVCQNVTRRVLANATPVRRRQRRQRRASRAAERRRPTRPAVRPRRSAAATSAGLRQSRLHGRGDHDLVEPRLRRAVVDGDAWRAPVARVTRKTGTKAVRAQRLRWDRVAARRARRTHLSWMRDGTCGRAVPAPRCSSSIIS